MKLIFFNFLFLFSLAADAENIVNATRVWPASDYTRVTIESSSAISNDQMILQNPERIVVDLKDIELNDTLKQLSSQVDSLDPNIKKIRVAQFNPKVTRLVIDLKALASVKIFSLKPFKEYKHRLVIDVYPKEKDELANLLKQLEQKDNEPSITEDLIDFLKGLAGYSAKEKIYVLKGLSEKKIEALKQILNAHNIKLRAFIMS